MTGRLRRHRLAAVVSLAALWLTTLASGSAAAATARVAESFTRDLYFVGSYEHQVDSRTCTAAATAMMENMIARRDLGLDQMAILRYEQPRDALNDATQRGSDPLGWSRAATYFSSRTPYLTTYKWEAYATESTALRRVATQLAKTGKPGGLLVLHGTHAMVMTGFIATADPRKGPFTLSYVYVSDPNGYAHYRYTAAGSPLDTYLETDASRTYDLAWYGKYVVIVPQDA
ncbi:MAG TPA: hypothetical protein VIK65_02395 [Candidatus Limnocylindrales bacterium]|jgi:hypothetical protein